MEAMVTTRRGWTVVWSGDDLGAYLSASPPTDVLILDLDLKGLTVSADEVHQVVERGIAVLVVSAMADPAAVRLVARAGASGFVSKADSETLLLDAVETVGNGQHWLPGEMMQILVEDDAHASVGLTAQERRVLELYSSGMTVAALARILSISPATVHVHLKQIRAKFAAINRPAAGPIGLYKRAVEFGYAPATNYILECVVVAQKS